MVDGATALVKCRVHTYMPSVSGNVSLLGSSVNRRGITARRLVWVGPGAGRKGIDDAQCDEGDKA